MQNQPLVSVGLPTYNRLDKLKQTLTYLKNQSYQNIEIIVSDNHSPHADIEIILKEFQRADKRLKYFIQKKNIEIEPNFNFVYHQANGEYFIWISDDDRFDYNYIEVCVNFLEKNKDYVLCSGVSKYYNGDQFLFQENIFQLENKIPTIRLIKYFINVNKNGIFYGVYKNNLRFSSPIQKHIGADWSHIARTVLLGKIHMLDTVQIQRSDDGGSSSRKKIYQRWKAEGLKKLFLETYTAYKISKNLFNDPILKERYSKIYRTLIQLLIFVLLNFKFLLNSIIRRIK